MKFFFHGLLKVHFTAKYKMQSEWTIISMINSLKGKVDKQEITINEMAASLEEKDIKLKIQEKQLEDTKGQLANVSYALQEFAASLFNQETQQQSWRELRDLFIQDGVYDYLEEPLIDTSKWRHPTTRQGDELERRFDELEAKLVKIGTLFPPSKISQERVKRSFDLCGNE